MPNASIPAKGAHLTDSSQSKASNEQTRFVSLDVFRGLTIFLMLLVNNIALDAATPAQLTHALWNRGVNLADLVFPWFLLCMGVAIPLSFRSAAKKGIAGLALGWKVISRSIGLFMLGLMLDSSMQHQPVFGIGVLQLLALAYLGGAILARLPVIYRVLASISLLAIYGLSLKYVTLSGYPVAQLEENANLIRFLNDTYLTTPGLRGLPSVIPTMALVALGSTLGEFLCFSTLDRRLRLTWVAVIGGSCSLLGFWWNISLPFNKPLWTPAYILLSFGLGALAIVVLSVIFDHEVRLKWAVPLVVLGSNALLAYAGPILIKGLILQTWTLPGSHSHQTLQDAWLTSVKSSWGPYKGGLVYTATYIGATWLALFVCYRKGWFLKI